MKMNFIKSLVLNKNNFGFIVFINKIYYMCIQTFLVLPALTRVLGPEQYGVLATLQTISVFISIFFTFYLPSLLGHEFHSRKNNQESLNKLISTLTLCAFVICVLLYPFIVFGLFVYQDIVSLKQDNLWLIFLVAMPLSQALSVFSGLFTMYLNQGKNFLHLNILNFCNSTFNASAIIICLFIFELGVGSVFWATLITNFITCVYSLISLFRSNLISLQFEKEFIINNKFFLLGGVFYGIVMWVYNYIDHTLLTYFHGATITGAYALNYKVSAFIQIFYLAFWSVCSPNCLNYLSNKSEENERSLSSTVSLYFTVLCWAYMFIVCFGGILVTAISGGDYQLSPLVILLCATAFLFMGMRKYFDVYLWYDKKIFLMFILTGFIPAIINTTLNLIMIPSYIEIGAALATFTSAFIVILISWFYNKKFYIIIIDHIFLIRYVSIIIVFILNVIVFNYLSILSIGNQILLFVIYSLLLLTCYRMNWRKMEKIK